MTETESKTGEAGRPPASRGTIHQEDAVIIERQDFAGDQYWLRLQAPATAAAARPGNFVHLVCDPELPLRRPMSIMRAGAEAGWIEILFKAHGRGTRLLAARQVGEQLNLLGPIGAPFRPEEKRRRPLLIGGGVGIPPMLFLADWLRQSAGGARPFVLMGSEGPFPFTVKPSRILVPGIPEGVIAAMPLLDDWGIPSRLASGRGFPGCYQGLVTDLTRHWLQGLDAETLQEIEVFACGPEPMLRAVATLAREFGLPCQISLEEYMACGVGGCAGCTVPVRTAQGPTMLRVCVDGPVFDAAEVYPVSV
jgi:dihydroorotate dehydrogenase electron transfer subunit